MPRKKKTEDAVILKMILEVLVKKGASTFSLMDLSIKTGLAPATLLQRFGSKEAILHKAIELANQELKDDFASRPIENKSPIKEIVDIYLELSIPFSSPVDVANGLDILKLDITETKLNTLTRKYFDIRRNKIESLIMLAQKKGEISTDTDVKDMAWNLECLWQGAIMLWALTGKGQIDEWIKKRFFTTLGIC